MTLLVLMGFESTGQTRVSYSWVMEARMESSPQGTVIELRRLHSSRGGSRFFLILSFLVVERDFFAPDPVVDAKLLLSASPLLLLLLLLLLCMQA
jgi:hypothetical protein